MTNALDVQVWMRGRDSQADSLLGEDRGMKRLLCSNGTNDPRLWTMSHGGADLSAGCLNRTATFGGYCAISLLAGADLGTLGS